MDAHDWNVRYEGTDLVWSAGPNMFVEAHAGVLAPGRALDVACGEGRNAAWLAQRGWDVVGVDYSDVAIDKAGAIAGRLGVDVDYRVGDVTDPDVVDGTFDLVLVAYLQLPGPALDAILAHLAGRVAPQGRLLLVGHHVDNLERGHGGPSDPAVLHDPAHLADLLADCGLTVEQHGAVDRTVETDDGPRTAIDALLMARRSEEDQS